MDDDPDRPARHHVIDRLMAWSNHQLYLMGGLAWAGTLPSKPLERSCTCAFPKLAAKHTTSIRFTIRRRLAHLSDRRTHGVDADASTGGCDGYSSH